MGRDYIIEYIGEKEDTVISELNKIGAVGEKYEIRNALRFISKSDRSEIEAIDGITEVRDFSTKDAFLLFCEGVNSRDWLKELN